MNWSRPWRRPAGQERTGQASRPAPARRPPPPATPPTATPPKNRSRRSKFDVGVPTKDLSAKVPEDLPAGYGKDRIVVMVRDPYWLHCYWELTRQAIQRAEAALGQDWHGAKPILRLLDVSSHDTTSTSEVDRPRHRHPRRLQQLVHRRRQPAALVTAWTSATCRAAAGSTSLARSNVVTTPRAGVSDIIDENWADIDAKQGRPHLRHVGRLRPDRQQPGTEAAVRGTPAPAAWARRPSPASAPAPILPGKLRKFWFQLDAELIVYGATEPNARVTLQGEPVKLRPDGTFTMRFSLPDSRQIIPAVATSADGIEERTIVLAVERNTKQLEPMIHDVNE